MNEEDSSSDSRALPGLTSQGRALLRRVLNEELISPSDPGFAELDGLGILVPELYRPGLFVIAQRSQIESHLQQSAKRQLAEAVEFSSGIRAFLDDLEAEQARGGGSGWRSSMPTESVFLEGANSVHKVMARVTDSARSEVLTMHPGKRPRNRLEKSVARDVELLRSGVRIRTLYQRANLAVAATRRWVSVVTEAGARVRTLDAPIIKTIVIDDAHAFVPDPKKPVSAGAWYIRDPAAISYFQQVFENEWRRAAPWDTTGIPVESERAAAESELPAPATVTTPRQRSILRAICAGLSYAQAGAQLGVKQRTIADDMAKLRQSQGLATNEQLTFWWATAPDRLLND
ncbi:hypothetical protein [Streptomyces sp. AC1-42T]|uniref:hypothetical protein n=1 Tax=Streptomyces sp. AC1-42T TaxID=2218665 RepID=UPI000DADF5FF|nr:hypothetical protein [Streptomyces sp. AC1-42T]PZT71534.1 hypothetical protein DNK55_33020 [Streptomyces sp. AC1-42T]